MRKFAVVSFTSMLFLGAVFAYQQARFSDGKLRIVFCDVGQGDAVFIRTPNKQDILIDGGPDNSVLNCLSEHMPFWDKEIELVFATHPDADHITGLVAVFENYKVKSFNTSKKTTDTAIFKRLNSTIAKHYVPVRYIYSGDKFKVGQVELLTFWPTAEYVSADNKSVATNNFSLIQLLSYGDFTALFTGDNIASNLEGVFTEPLSVDVLKVPHHGSKTGLNATLLQELAVNMAVISVGKNSYGHPTPFILDLLNQFGIKTLRTDRGGEVEIISDGRGWGIK